MRNNNIYIIFNKINYINIWRSTSCDGSSSSALSLFYVSLFLVFLGDGSGCYGCKVQLLDCPSVLLCFAAASRRRCLVPGCGSGRASLLRFGELMGFCFIGLNCSFLFVLLSFL